MQYKTDSTISVRIPKEFRAEFLEACRNIDRTGSQMLRMMMNNFIMERADEATKQDEQQEEPEEFQQAQCTAQEEQGADNERRVSDLGKEREY